MSLHTMIRVILQTTRLWFYAAGVNNPIPTNPSKLNIPLLPTEIIPSSYSNGGANAWIFYRPLAGWSY